MSLCRHWLYLFIAIPNNCKLFIYDIFIVFRLIGNQKKQMVAMAYILAFSEEAISDIVVWGELEKRYTLAPENQLNETMNAAVSK